MCRMTKSMPRYCNKGISGISWYICEANLKHQQPWISWTNLNSLLFGCLCWGHWFLSIISKNSWWWQSYHKILGLDMIAIINYNMFFKFRWWSLPEEMYTFIYEEGHMMQLAIGIQREKWYVFTPHCIYIYIYVYIERERERHTYNDILPTKRM